MRGQGGSLLGAADLGVRDSFTRIRQLFGVQGMRFLAVSLDQVVHKTLLLVVQCRRNETINSESKWITLCLMNILQTCVVALPIIVYEHDNPALGFGVQSFAVLVAFGGTIAMLFVPKLLLSKEEMEAMDRNLTTATSGTNGVRAHNTSSSQKDTSREIAASSSTGTELAQRFSHNNPMV